MIAATLVLWGLAVAPSTATPTEDFSTWGTISYDSGSCGADASANVVTDPGITQIISAGSNIWYVVGCFTNFAGVTGADYIAKWDGSTWSRVGAANAINKIVHDAAIYKGKLYIAGEFTDVAGDVAADMVAYWDGASWHPLATSPSGCASNTSGLCSPKGNSADYAVALHVTTDGSDMLIVGGFFKYGLFSDSPGGVLANSANIAQWDGTAWSSIGESTPYSSAANGDMVVRDIATIGSLIYVGTYRNAGYYSGRQLLALLKWNGSTWSQSFTSVSPYGYSYGYGVSRLLADGTDLIIGGNFDSANGVASYLAKLDTTNGTLTAMPGFSPLMVGGQCIRSLAKIGTQLFVGGDFIGIGSAGDRFARLSNNEWFGVPISDYHAINALYVNENYSGTLDRLIIAAPAPNLAGLAAADGLVAMNIESTSRLDSMTITNIESGYSFSPDTTTYSVTLPYGVNSAVFTPVLEHTSNDMRRVSGGTETQFIDSTYSLSVADGATSSAVFKIYSSDGTSSTTYTFNVTGGTAPAPTVAPTQAPPEQSPKTTDTSSSVSSSAAPAAPSGPTPMAPKAKRAPAALATQLGMNVPTKAKVTLAVAKSSKKFCKVSGGKLVALKPGNCAVTVTVQAPKPKGGKKPKAVKQKTFVSIG